MDKRRKTEKRMTKGRSERERERRKRQRLAATMQIHFKALLRKVGSVSEC